MHLSSRTSSFTIWTGCLLLASVLILGPAGIRHHTEAVLMELAGAGAALATSGANKPSPDQEHDTKLERLAAQNRQLAVMVAQLQHELEQSRGLEHIPQSLPNGSKLTQTVAVTTRVLGRRGEQSTADLLIALGKQSDLTGEELVLAGEGDLIAGGESLGIAADELVCQGRQLLGRITQTGRWSSLVQPVTDADFKVAVQIIRHSELGPVWGPQGILVGTGTSCEILEVPATQPVAVGDHVYTHSTASPTSELVYCGRISNINLGPQDQSWTIQVSPAVTNTPATVTVLKSQLNPQVISLQPELSYPR